MSLEITFAGTRDLDGQPAIILTGTQDDLRAAARLFGQPVTLIAAGAVADIAAERQRQIDVEGWSHEHDDAHFGGELARAAGEYATHAGVDHAVRMAFGPGEPAYGWPWSADWWKPKTRREDLVRAGALIIAEIERLDRAAAQVANGGDT